MKQNRLYVSLREIALLMHAGVRYDSATHTVAVTYGEHSAA
ncbi:stalk domain-containing protein [Paenibacillus sp. UNC496MF]